MQDFRCDLHKIGIKLTFIPLVKNITDLLRGEAKAAAEQVIAFADQLHIRIFNAVMHPLDKMAGPIFTNMGHAWFAFSLGSDRLEYRLQVIPRPVRAPRHHRRPVQSALFTAGNTAADEMQAAGTDIFFTADSIFKIRIAAVNNDIFRFKNAQKLFNNSIRGTACRDHQDHFARFFK